MATSFLNDISYVRDIIWKITDVATVLYGARSLEMKEIEALLQLNDDELQALGDDEDDDVEIETSINRGS